MRTLFVGMSFVLTAAACVSGPDYRAPVPEAPARWQAAEGAVREGSLAGWWRQFGDEDLTALVERAVQSSPDVRSAQAKLLEARARGGVAQAALYPVLTNTVSARRSEVADKGVATDSFSVGFDASWELDLFGGTRRSVEAAHATVAAADFAVRDAQLSLVAEVARVYVDARTQQARWRIAQENLASQRETTQLVQWRAQAGLVTALDVLQAQTALAQSEARLPALAAALEADVNRLAVLAGLSRVEVASRLEPWRAIPVAPALFGLGVPADTLRQRPDVRAAERRLAAQTASVGAAQAARYPDLKLSGTLGVSALSSDALLRSSALSSSVLAGLTTPIFDAGRLRQNVVIQSALQEQALIAYEKTVAQALADVETALVALRSSRERQISVQTAADLARAAAALAEQRYAKGLIDYAAVLETQRTLQTLDDSGASVAGELATALVQLYKSLGGGFAATPDTDNPAGALAHE